LVLAVLRVLAVLTVLAVIAGSGVFRRRVAGKYFGFRRMLLRGAS
jgi:hypothetical protein